MEKMPPSVNKAIKRKVIEQWISGCPRDNIALDNNIGADTVSSIISNYKLEYLEFDYLRELAVEVRKLGLNFADLASHVRLYNFIRKSGATEDLDKNSLCEGSVLLVPHKENLPLTSSLFLLYLYNLKPLYLTATNLTQLVHLSC
jgi:hypothetical protein